MKGHDFPSFGTGLTQAELAKRVGKDQTSISIIERGQRRVDVLEFVALARAMEVDPGQLFERVTSRLSKAGRI